MSSKLSPADIANGWTEAEFDRLETYLASSAPLFDPNDSRDEHRILAPDVLPPPVGHNQPPPEPPSDPGPDRNFAITLELPEEVRNRRDCKAFERLLQEQGDHEHRFAALDQADWRVRGNPAVPHAAYRFYS